MTMNPASLPALWGACVDQLKDRVNNRSFWEAIEQTVPITIENSTLIIGLDPMNFNLATHIQQVARMQAVQQVVQEQYGQPLSVRLIEGTALPDWESTKVREARVTAMRAATTERQIKEDSVAGSWEAIYDQVGQLYRDTALRMLPQNKARYANEALYALVEAMDGLYAEEPDEASERNLARILDRIATASEIPAPVLAFELERLRTWRKSSGDSASF